MVFLAKFGDDVHHTSRLPYELKKANGLIFECICCKGKLTYVGQHKRHGIHVMGHFRHIDENINCDLEHDSNNLFLENTNFHLSWTVDLVKAKYLYGYWNHKNTYDIKNIVGEYIFVKHGILKQRDVQNKEKYGEKIVWILDMNTRQCSLVKDEDQIMYVNFQGKVDIPYFKESIVYLDTGCDRLINVNVAETPHEIYGWKATFIKYEEVLSNHFSLILKDGIVTNTRQPLNITVHQISDKQNTVLNTTDCLKHIVAIKNTPNCWKLTQNGVIYSIPYLSIAQNVLILKGMSMQIINTNYSYTHLYLPETFEAATVFFNDFYHKFESCLKPIEMWFKTFQEHVLNWMAKGMEYHYATEQCYEHLCRQAKNHDDKPDISCIKRYLKKIKLCLNRCNKYNDVMLELSKKQYSLSENNQNILRNMCENINNINLFVDNPYSISTTYTKWFTEDNLQLLIDIAKQSQVSKDTTCIAMLKAVLLSNLHENNRDSCMYIEELCDSVKTRNKKQNCGYVLENAYIKKVLEKEEDNEFIFVSKELYIKEIINGDEPFEKRVLTMVYLLDVYNQEVEIANRIYELTQRKHIFLSGHKVPIPSPKNIATLNSDYEKYKQQNGIDDYKFHKKQAEAIQKVFQSNFTVITGVPGAGKSDVVKQICNILLNFCRLSKDHICLCAPTAKAASKLKYSNGNKIIEPATIDKILYKNHITSKQCSVDSDSDSDSDSESESESESDDAVDDDTLKMLPYRVLIIDEVSMVSTTKCFNIFQHINTDNTKIVIIGDNNQLPSIEYGDFLRKLVLSKTVENHHVHLPKAFRYGKNITNISKNILKGKPFPITNTSSIQWHKCQDMKQIQGMTYAIYEECKSQNREIQVIIPTRNNCVSLNTMFHNKLKPNHSSHKFFSQERVLCTKNQKSLNNGDFAFVATLQPEDKEYLLFRTLNSVNNWKNDNSNAKDAIKVKEQYLDYSYAITVHKSQGSEYDTVVIILGEKSSFLNQNLIYTAFTRVQEKMHIFYDNERTIYDAIRNKYFRHSCFDVILKRVFSE